MSRAPRIEPPRLAELEVRLSPRQSDGWSASVFLGSGNTPGQVTSFAAENLGAVTGCIELIAGTLASLPAYVYAQTDAGRKEAAASHPVARLIRRPNRGQSWPSWIQWAVAQVLLRGNCLSWVRLDGRGAPVELVPVPWQWVQPQVLPSGRLVFDVLHATPEAQFLGLPARLLDTDVLHLKARSDVGILGRSVLSRAAAVIAAGIDLQDATAATWRNGMKPGGLLTRDKFLSDAMYDRQSARIRESTGTNATGKTLLLEGGWSYQQMGLSSVDAEMLASRKLSTAEVARLFCMPVQMLDGERPVPSLAPYVVAFAQLCLAPIVASIEAEFADSVFASDTHTLGIDMGGLTRGDFATRWGAWAVAIQSRILTVDEVREIEGYGPLPAGAFADPVPAGQEGAASPQNPNPGTDYPPDRTGLPSLSPKPGAGGSSPGSHAGEGRP